MNNPEKKPEKKKEEKKFSPVRVLLYILFAPVIVLCLIADGFLTLCRLAVKPFRIRKYKRSAYFAAFGKPYREGILTDALFLFYNSAAQSGKEKGFVRASDGIACYDDGKRLYVFCHTICGGAHFTGICRDDSEQSWNYIRGGASFPLDKEWESAGLKLQGLAPDRERKLLIRRADLFARNKGAQGEKEDRAIGLLPGYAAFVEEYTDVLSA